MKKSHVYFLDRFNHKLPIWGYSFKMAETIEFILLSVYVGDRSVTQPKSMAHLDFLERRIVDVVFIELF